MSLRFSILGSGSSGNAAFMQTEQCRVLIDAGFSARKLGQLLGQIGETLASIDAIFLTHEHGDHSAGMRGLKKFPHIQVFANRGTAQAIQRTLDHKPAWQIFETGNRFRFKDMEVATFSVPHDAQDPVGFKFSCGIDGDLFSPPRALAYVTDLGHAPLHIHEQLRDCDAIVVEANHCPQMLEADLRRPWPTKQRISGRHGHLSNVGAFELLQTVASPRWRHVFLTHLSRDCNSPAAVATALAPLQASLRCVFSIVEPGGGTAVCEV